MASVDASGKKKDRWIWNEEKTEAFLLEVKNYKDKNLAKDLSGIAINWFYWSICAKETWRTMCPDDFGASEALVSDKPFQDITKEEYNEFTEDAKRVKGVIAVGYRNVSNKFKTLKRTYIKDFKDGLRSAMNCGVAQLVQCL